MKDCQPSMVVDPTELPILNNQSPVQQLKLATLKKLYVRLTKFINYH